MNSYACYLTNDRPCGRIAPCFDSPHSSVDRALASGAKGPCSSHGGGTSPVGLYPSMPGQHAVSPPLPGHKRQIDVMVGAVDPRAGDGRVIRHGRIKLAAGNGRRVGDSATADWSDDREGDARRRIQAVGTFTNEASCPRLARATLMAKEAWPLLPKRRWQIQKPSMTGSLTVESSV